MINVDYTVEFWDMCFGLPTGESANYHNPPCPIGCINVGAGLYAITQVVDFASCALGAPSCSLMRTCDKPPPPAPCTVALPNAFKVTVDVPGCFTFFTNIVIPSVGLGVYKLSDQLFGGGHFKADIIIIANLSGSLTIDIRVFPTSGFVRRPCLAIEGNSSSNSNCISSILNCGPPIVWSIVTTPKPGCFDYLPPSSDPSGFQNRTGDCEAFLSLCTGPINITVTGV